MTPSISNNLVSNNQAPNRLHQLPAELQSHCLSQLNPLSHEDAKALIKYAYANPINYVCIRSIPYKNPVSLFDIASLSLEMNTAANYDRHILLDHGHLLKLGCYRDCKIKLVDINKKLLCEFPQEGFATASVVLSNDKVAIGSHEFDKPSLRILNPKQGIHTRITPIEPISIMLKLSENMLATGTASPDGMMCFYNTDTGKSYSFSQHIGIDTMALLTDGHIAATYSRGQNNIGIYSPEKGLISTFPQKESAYSFLGLPDGLLATATDTYFEGESKIKIFDQSGRLISSQEQESHVSIMRYLPSGHIATQGFDSIDDILLYKISDFKPAKS